MMTFGDCMSLLVCFFVMLIAFSNMETEKLAAMMGAMRGALSGIDRIESIDTFEHEITADGLTRIEGDSDHLKFLTREELSTVASQMINELQASAQIIPHIWPDRLLIEMLDEGLAIIIHSKALFHPGSADWLNQGENTIWTGIAGLLRGRRNPIHIITSVDRETPVNSTASRTVWGLGLERAEAVAEALQASMNTGATQIGTGMRIHDHPPGIDAGRVEIIILGRYQVTDLDNGGTLPTGILR